MFKQNQMTLIFAVLFSLLLAACVPVTAPAPAAEKAVTPAEKIEIEFSAYCGGPGCDYYHKMVDEFEAANPNVIVKRDLSLGHEEWINVFQTRVAADALPDLFIQDENEIPKLLEADKALPLDDYIKQYNIDLNWYPQRFLAFATREGKHYALPYYISPNIMIYRTDVFEQAGIEPPKTWDDLLNVCKVFQDKMGLKHPFAFDPNGAWWSGDWIFQAGGDMMNPERTAFTFDSPEVVEAIQFMWDLIYKHQCVHPDIMKMENGRWVLWQKGEVVFMQAGGWELGAVDQKYPETIGKWRMTALPCGKQCANVAGGSPLMIAKSCKHPDVAFKLLATMVTPEGAYKWMKITGGAPAGNLATYDLEETKRDFPQFLGLKEAVANASVLPVHPLFAKGYFEIFQGGLQGIFANPNADIPTELKRINDAANEMLRREAE
ncbi:MAG: sugar ABC transporter substrate-binding protein [Anaerolineae bacterium]|nr:sugar ABC transporter substrate-binding protein [Anaerolineae bacterium]